MDANWCPDLQEERCALLASSLPEAVMLHNFILSLWPTASSPSAGRVRLCCTVIRHTCPVRVTFAFTERCLGDARIACRAKTGVTACS
eukprot:365587-Chlamydomonas_euryale.AAC.8